MDIDEILSTIYRDPEQTCNSRDTLWARVKQLGHTHISRRYCQAWLNKQEAYQLHRQVRKPKLMAPVTSSTPLGRVQIDLTGPWLDAHLNMGYNYVMSIVDVYSRKAWLIPLKGKDGPTVAAALEQWLSQYPQTKVVQTDRGSEFQAEFNAVLAKYHVTHVYSAAYSPTAQAIVERFNKTYKHMVYALMSQRKSKVWYLHLEAVAKNYNQRAHDTLAGATPDSVFAGSSDGKLLAAYRKHAASVSRSQSKPQELAVGDSVRVRIQKIGLSAKGYTPSWTKQLYTIAAVRRGRVPMVSLKEASGWYHNYNVQKVDRASLVTTEPVPTGPREETLAAIASRRRAGVRQTVYLAPETTLLEDRVVAAPPVVASGESVKFRNFNLQYLWDKLESLRKAEILRIFDGEFSGSASTLQQSNSAQLKEYVRRKLRKLSTGASTHIVGHGIATLNK